MKKKALSFLLIFVLLTTSVITVSADEDIGIQPFWTYVSSVDNTLEIKSGKAYVDLGYGLTSSSYNCRVYSRLQRQTTSGWTTVKSYDKTSTSRFFMDSYTMSLSTKGSYRLYTIFYVKNSAGTTVETITRYDYATY